VVALNTQGASGAFVFSWDMWCACVHLVRLCKTLA